MIKSIFVGALLGFAMSLIGSFLVSLIPFFPFYFIFKLSLIPSIIVFVIIAVWPTSQKSTPVRIWLRAFIVLFIGSILTFFNFNRFEGAFRFNYDYSSHLNWGAVITFNILYSLGIALVMSPIVYFVIKKVAHLYKHK